MEIIQEITVWDCEYKVPNNTYLLNNKGKLIAYIKEGDDIIRGCPNFALEILWEYKLRK